MFTLNNCLDDKSFNVFVRTNKKELYDIRKKCNYQRFIKIFIEENLNENTWSSVGKQHDLVL